MTKEAISILNCQNSGNPHNSGEFIVDKSILLLYGFAVFDDIVTVWMVRNRFGGSRFLAAWKIKRPAVLLCTTWCSPISTCSALCHCLIDIENILVIKKKRIFDLFHYLVEQKNSLWIILQNTYWKNIWHELCWMKNKQKYQF